MAELYLNSIPVSPISADNTDGPNTCSVDYEMMYPFWEMVQTLLDGQSAMIAKGEKYLPKFVRESDKSYKHRLKNAKFTNLYRDIVDGLSAKPFQKEVQIKEGSASDAIVGAVEKDEQQRDYRSGGLIEDIDGKGNHLHVFLADTFFNGIAYAVDWILVDKAPTPDNATIADERRLGARPYWVHIRAIDVIYIETARIDGKEQVVHFRIRERASVRQGWKEVIVNRVRVFNRDKLAPGLYANALWELFEEKDDGAGKKEWVRIDGGSVGIGVIPVVPFITGRRKGSSWQFHPPTQDIATLQIKHYQYESNLNCTKEAAAFPILAGNGVTPDTEEDGTTIKELEIGPGSVLYAPPNETGNSAWTFIEPSSESMKFLAEDIDNTERQMREIGRNPLTNESGNLTVVTTAFAAGKGNSAVQAWANDLEDAAESALQLTTMWLGDTSEPEVIVYKDFSIDLETDVAPDMLKFMRGNKDISRKSMLREAKRRDWLSPEFDAETDEKEIELEPKEEETPPQPGATQ